MIPLNLLIAALTILSPDAKFDAPPCPLPAFQGVAIQLELLDPRESRYTFAHVEDFSADLATIQSRAVDLADAPRIRDADRFPSCEFCQNMRRFNQDYCQFLEDLRLIDRSSWIDEALAETKEPFAGWDLATDAKCEYYYVYYRRRALRDLRDRIGPQAYYAGCLPPAVPVWRFQRTD